MSNPELVSVSPAVRDSFLPILQAVARAREDLAGKNDVAAVRPGYKYPTDAPPQPAIVVAVTPGERPVAEADLEDRYGVPVVVADATVEEQLARLSAAEPVLFGDSGRRGRVGIRKSGLGRGDRGVRAAEVRRL